MSTHAGALLLAALAYTYARKRAGDPNFTFGTGKFGDLAGFTSAIILAMIALLIAYESVSRLFAPVTIHFAEAIPIACLGLAVNIASAWLLSGGGHHHGHSHGHAHEVHDHDEAHHIATAAGVVVLEVFEDGVPPRFRLRVETGPALTAQATSVETVRADGTRQLFAMKDQGGYLESVDEIPEPHAFTAHVRMGQQDYPVVFEEHEHAHESAHRDNNMRAAVIHVMADAAVSVLVITGLVARPRLWLALDGPARGHRRRDRHRQLVLRPHPRYRRDPARHEPRPRHGTAHARYDRGRWRSADRPAPLASRARPSGRDRVGQHRQAEGSGLLSTAAQPISLLVACDRRI